jgi:hypothetical protein
MVFTIDNLEFLNSIIVSLKNNAFSTLHCIYYKNEYFTWAQYYIIKVIIIECIHCLYNTVRYGSDPVYGICNS